MHEWIEPLKYYVLGLALFYVLAVGFMAARWIWIYRDEGLNEFFAPFLFAAFSWTVLFLWGDPILKSAADFSEEWGYLLGLCALVLCSLLLLKLIEVMLTSQRLQPMGFGWTLVMACFYTMAYVEIRARLSPPLG